VKTKKMNTRNKRTALLAVMMIALLSAIVVITPASAATETFSPDADSGLDENAPTTRAGDYDWMQVMTRATNRNRRCIIHFDLSSLPSGASIDSATLYLYIASVNADRTDDIHRITAEWNETLVTWNIQPGYDSTPTNSISTGTTADTWVEYDVTSDVQAFVDGTPNYGWLIKDHTESESTAQYVKHWTREYTDANKHPYLEVTYTESEPADVIYDGTVLLFNDTFTWYDSYSGDPHVVAILTPHGALETAASEAGFDYGGSWKGSKNTALIDWIEDYYYNDSIDWTWNYQLNGVYQNYFSSTTGVSNNPVTDGDYIEFYYGPDQETTETHGRGGERSGLLRP
jgi:hypothetical protein